MKIYKIFMFTICGIVVCISFFYILFNEVINVKMSSDFKIEINEFEYYSKFSHRKYGGFYKSKIDTRREAPTKLADHWVLRALVDDEKKYFVYYTKNTPNIYMLDISDDSIVDIGETGTIVRLHNDYLYFEDRDEESTYLKRLCINDFTVEVVFDKRYRNMYDEENILYFEDFYGSYYKLDMDKKGSKVLEIPPPSWRTKNP